VQGRRPRLSSELFEHRSAGDSASAGPLSIRLAPAPLKIDPPKIGRSDLSVKELPNAEIRLSSGRRYLALVRNCSNYPSRPAKTRRTSPSGNLRDQCRANKRPIAVGRSSLPGGSRSLGGHDGRASPAGPPVTSLPGQVCKPLSSVSGTAEISSRLTQRSSPSQAHHASCRDGRSGDPPLPALKGSGDPARIMPAKRLATTLRLLSFRTLLTSLPHSAPRASGRATRERGEDEPYSPQTCHGRG
jgi:hypothetical protein